MFIVILTVIALADYIITAYCILNMVGKPDETVEPPKYKAVDNAVTEHTDVDEELIRYIEEQNHRIALLSFNVNKILSNIDEIIREKKEI